MTLGLKERLKRKATPAGQLTAAKRKSGAQLRRLEKRARARAGLPPADAEDKPLTASARAELPQADAEAKPLTARDRRLARRAAKRAASAAVPTAATEDEPPSNLTSKQRRLLRRAALRSGEAAPAIGTAAEASETAIERAPDARSHVVPYVVFVGQLPFEATPAQLTEHFRKGGVQGDLSVRMLTDAKTGKSKGMAFVEMADPAQLHTALALHRSYFPGARKRRQINVEKSVGGSKATRQGKIESARAEQQAHMQATVERIIEEHVAKGSLSRSLLEEDKYLKSMLHRCSGATVDQALTEFGEVGRELENPAAYLTAIVCRIMTEHFDGDAPARPAHGGKRKGSSARDDAAKRPRSSEVAPAVRPRTPETQEQPPKQPDEAPESVGLSQAALARRFPSFSGRGRSGRVHYRGGGPGRGHSGR